MNRTASLALSLMAATAATFSTSMAPAYANEQSPGVQIGTLTCNVEGDRNFVIGSTSTLGCNYKPVSGAAIEYYTGTVDEFGLDIGTTDQATLIWGVFAPSADMEPGALAGHYGGLTAGASVGAGLKANVLVGGLDKSIALNPVSVESQTGTNVTLGVSQLTLKPIQ